jgi:hypothetical protein
MEHDVAGGNVRGVQSRFWRWAQTQWAPPTTRSLALGRPDQQPRETPGCEPSRRPTCEAQVVHAAELLIRCSRKPSLLHFFYTAGRYWLARSGTDREVRCAKPQLSGTGRYGTKREETAFVELIARRSQVQILPPPPTTLRFQGKPGREARLQSFHAVGRMDRLGRVQRQQTAGDGVAEGGVEEGGVEDLVEVLDGLRAERSATSAADNEESPVGRFEVVGSEPLQGRVAEVGQQVVLDRGD